MVQSNSNAGNYRLDDGIRYTISVISVCYAPCPRAGHHHPPH